MARRTSSPQQSHMHLFMMKKTISSCSRYMSDSGRRDAMIIVITARWKPSGKA